MCRILKYACESCIQMNLRVDTRCILIQAQRGNPYECPQKREVMVDTSLVPLQCNRCSAPRFREAVARHIYGTITDEEYARAIHMEINGPVSMEDLERQEQMIQDEHDDARMARELQERLIDQEYDDARIARELQEQEYARAHQDLMDGEQSHECQLHGQGRQDNDGQYLDNRQQSIRNNDHRVQEQHDDARIAKELQEQQDAKIAQDLMNEEQSHEYQSRGRDHDVQDRDDRQQNIRNHDYLVHGNREPHHHRTNSDSMRRQRSYEPLAEGHDDRDDDDRGHGRRDREERERHHQRRNSDSTIRQRSSCRDEEDEIRSASMSPSELEQIERLRLAEDNQRRNTGAPRETYVTNGPEETAEQLYQKHTTLNAVLEHSQRKLAYGEENLSVSHPEEIPRWQTFIKQINLEIKLTNAEIRRVNQRIRNFKQKQIKEEARLLQEKEELMRELERVRLEKAHEREKEGEQRMEHEQERKIREEEARVKLEQERKRREEEQHLKLEQETKQLEERQRRASLYNSDSMASDQSSHCDSDDDSYYSYDEDDSNGGVSISVNSQSGIEASRSHSIPKPVCDRTLNWGQSARRDDDTMEHQRQREVPQTHHRHLNAPQHQHGPCDTLQSPEEDVIGKMFSQMIRNLEIHRRKDPKTQIFVALDEENRRRLRSAERPQRAMQREDEIALAVEEARRKRSRQSRGSVETPEEYERRLRDRSLAERLARDEQKGIPREYKLPYPDPKADDPYIQQGQRVDDSDYIQRSQPMHNSHIQQRQRGNDPYIQQGQRRRTPGRPEEQHAAYVRREYQPSRTCLMPEAWVPDAPLRAMPWERPN